MDYRKLEQDSDLAQALSTITAVCSICQSRRYVVGWTATGPVYDHSPAQHILEVGGVA